MVEYNPQLKSNPSLRFKNISLAILGGVLAEGLQDITTRFFHDFTNTEYKESDHTTPILSSWIITVSLEFMKIGNNIITIMIFASGLTLSVGAVINNIIYKEDIDCEKIVRSFLYDSTFLTIIMYIYKLYLEELNPNRKKNPDGAIFIIVRDVIRVLPMVIYFAYRQFQENLNN